MPEFLSLIFLSPAQTFLKKALATEVQCFGIAFQSGCGRLTHLIVLKRAAVATYNFIYILKIWHGSLEKQA